MPNGQWQHSVRGDFSTRNAVRKTGLVWPCGCFLYRYPNTWGRGEEPRDNAKFLTTIGRKVSSTASNGPDGDSYWRYWFVMAASRTAAGADRRGKTTYEGALVIGECANQCGFASLVYLQGHCASDSCPQSGGVRTGSGAGSGGKPILRSKKQRANL
jgi:hypothetical protein